VQREFAELDAAYNEKKQAIIAEKDEWLAEVGKRLRWRK
jgi:hypothetical protein